MLRIPFVINILILAPVCWSMFFADNGRAQPAFEGKAPESRPLRLLVASFWSAILVLSLAALAEPSAFVPVLVLQVVYKALWLAVFALPEARRAGRDALPMGVTVSFAAIVLVWPFFIAAAWF